VEGANSSMIYLIHLRTLLNNVMYPHPTQQWKTVFKRGQGRRDCNCIVNSNWGVSKMNW
jgi:hypothetical protein